MTRQLGLRRAAWLADDVLIAACSSKNAVQPGDSGVRSTRAAARLLTTSDGLDPEPVVIAGVPASALDRGLQGLLLEGAGVRVAASNESVREALTDLKTFVREHLAHLDADTRSRMQASLVAAGAEHGMSRALADSLYAVREALRERRAAAVVGEPAERVGVERLHRIDDNEFYLRGWVRGPADAAPTLSAISPEGERVELHPRANFDRHLGEGRGFVCHFRTQAPSRRENGWLVELGEATGRGVEVATKLTSTDPDAARRAIVADASGAGLEAEAIREDHVRPALKRLQELRRESVTITAVETHGIAPDAPEVSVIVPLFDRVDLVEHQIVQFAGDPELARCEIIYVLDTPDERDLLARSARDLERLFGIPFRIATLSANGGVAIARNLGASLASGRRLLFLDSDVFPARVGWIGQLARAYDGIPEAGAVAAKLVYEDESVQHAGLFLHRASDAPVWDIEHPMKGVHTSLPAANSGGRVPAVSGACFMTDASLYRHHGGMSWEYVQGDYEDADLCLRMAREGRHSVYVPEVSLYHLEAQSYSADARAANREYNRWLFGRTWAEELQELPV